jgi:hypothetical protein
VVIAEEDKHKTAFSTVARHYAYNRMLLGLKAAPAIFKRMMNIILREI